MGCIIYNDRNIRGQLLSNEPVLLFERRYYPLVSEAIDDLVIFYAARTTRSGGEYYAVGRVGRICSSVGDGHLTASVSEFTRLEAPVPAFGAAGVYESALIGRNWRSMVQRAVRAIPDIEAEAILNDACATPVPAADNGFGEERQSPYMPFQRRREHVERWCRCISLRQRTRTEYQHRCSFTGCGQRGKFGQIEAECCHIVPVEDGGIDVISNTLLLGRSIHWAFDQHAISLNDDFSFIVTDRLAPQYASLLNPDGYAWVPKDPQLRPSVEFLRQHRSRMKAISRP